MCRTHEVTFWLCGHRDPSLNKHFRCKNYLHCGPQIFIKHAENGLCSSCYQTPRRTRHSAILNDGFGFGDARKQGVRKVLKLAAKAGKRYSTWQFANANGVVLRTFKYDSENEHVFAGKLDTRQGNAMSALHLYIACYIGDASLPKLTDNEMKLFRQIRTAAIGSNIENIEAKLERELELSLLSGRLDDILTPTAVPENDPDCSICTESLKEPGTSWWITRFWDRREDAARLPCGHVYGRKCIHAWVGSWEVENGLGFPVCPQCTKNFDILPRIHQEVQPPVGTWYEFLKHAWYTGFNESAQA